MSLPGGAPTAEVLARRRKLVSLLVGALAAVALALGLRGTGSQRETPEVRPVGMELGADGVYAVAGTRGNGRLLFSDGSRVIAGRGSRLRLARVAPGAVTLELLNGEIYLQIEVDRLPPEREGAPLQGWLIQAGPYRVEAPSGRLSLAWLAAEGLFALRVEKDEAYLDGPAGGRVRAGESRWLDARGRALAPGRALPPAPAD